MAEFLVDDSRGPVPPHAAGRVQRGPDRAARMGGRHADQPLEVPLRPSMAQAVPGDSDRLAGLVVVSVAGDKLLAIRDHQALAMLALEPADPVDEALLLQSPDLDFPGPAALAGLLREQAEVRAEQGNQPTLKVCFRGPQAPAMGHCPTRKSVFSIARSSRAFLGPQNVANAAAKSQNPATKKPQPTEDPP